MSIGAAPHSTLDSPRSSGAPAAERAQPWIISRPADLLLLIAAPLAIVPLVSWAAAHWLATERISLVVIAFGSLGHHLPGFMRAYGDRELFERFRWRLLLAPVGVFAAALAFAAYDLHGLALVLFFWATWHGLMQTYGFMRIYDLKHGVAERQAARADFALCITIFAAGMVFSDARVYGCADMLAKTGLPLPGADALRVVRWAVGAALLLALAAFGWQLAGRARRGVPWAWPRLALIVTTGWLYWVSGLLATDMLLGVAMFEIFHAVQYDAIVWATHRTRVRRNHSLRRPLAAVFEQPRWASLSLYVSLILAFGAVRLIDSVRDSWVTWVLVALVTTSTLLHYYFDGFIWKVREPKTRTDLAIENASPPPAQRAGRFGHAAAWAALTILGAGLFYWERFDTAASADTERERLAGLLALTPNLPELQWRASDEARAAGDVTGAIEAAQSAAGLRPGAPQSHERLGAALLEADRNEQAADEFAAAARLAPARWENQLNLAIALGRLGRWQASDEAFGRAARLRPQSAAVQSAWARRCLRQPDDLAAIEHGLAALRADANDFELRMILVRLLAHVDRALQAVHLAQRGVELSPQSAVAHRSLGEAWLAADNLATAIQELELAAEQFKDQASPDAIQAAECYGAVADAQLQLARTDAAEQSLERALTLNPQSAVAHFHRATLHYSRGDSDAAARDYRRCLDLQPDFAPAYINLASVLLGQGDLGHARKAYERGLTLDPQNSLGHYNLGLLLWNQGETGPAREHLRRARELGASLTDPLAAWVDETQ